MRRELRLLFLVSLEPVCSLSQAFERQDLKGSKLVLLEGGNPDICGAEMRQKVRRMPSATLRGWYAHIQTCHGLRVLGTSRHPC
jgi:hypothetical protein